MIVLHATRVFVKIRIKYGIFKVAIPIVYAHNWSLCILIIFTQRYFLLKSIETFVLKKDGKQHWNREEIWLVSRSAIIISTAGVCFVSRKGNRFQYEGSRLKLNRNEKYRNDIVAVFPIRRPSMFTPLCDATGSPSLYAERVLVSFLGSSSGFSMEL